MSIAEFDINAPTGPSRFSYETLPGDGKAISDRELAEQVLDLLGIDATDAEGLRRETRHNGATLGEEIVASGRATASALAQAIASCLRLVADDPTEDATIVKDARGSLRCGPAYLVATATDCSTRFFMAPDLERLNGIAQTLPVSAADRDRIRIATLESIAAVSAADSCRQRSDAARLSLAADLNRWSAREVLTAFQGAALTFLMTGLLVASLLLGSHMWLGLHLFFTATAFACTMFRLVVLVGSHRPVGEVTPLSRDEPDAGFPFYSVLVALHHEAEIAADTVAAMAALDWPRSRLEVLFVCEATDPETIAAVERAIAPQANFTVVVTPASRPTTKPKALNFALPLTRGEFVVLYDAEDRPDPGQLREAYARFHTTDDRLACLQAPLVVTNGATGWRQAHFAMEYAVLFRMLLPWLAARHLPLPLGGTSNHFRRSHLVSAGGWDSHNVAEDADLGIRLARLGFRSSTLSSPTYETSTTSWRDWRNQRTRWMKGWVQTWLVHMRDPRLARRQLGWRGLVSFQIVFTGMIASAFAHLVLVAHLICAILLWQADTALLPGHGWLALIDAVNLALAYLVFALSVVRVSAPDDRTLRIHLLSLWGYWAIVSYAAMRAIWQLRSNPHLWEKTPHQRLVTPPSAETASVG